jgi:hypothetical protein
MVRAGYVCFALSVATAVISSCRCDDAPGPAPAASASAAASAHAAASATAEPAEDDDVKPVYPQSNDPPDPRATKYCDLVHELPEKKRKECCPAHPVTLFRPTGECVRTLTHALGSKALTLDLAELSSCEAALLEEAKHCDWGGTLPAACEGLLKGQLAEKELCRSALECKSGLECRGLGATTPGKCMPARPAGVQCGGVSDTLGAFTRQDAERGHEECEGYCQRRRCVKAGAIGEKCDRDHLCARGLRCDKQKCTEAPLPTEGQPCTDGPGACARNLRCAGGQCVAPKRIGEACATSEECRSQSCVGGEAGKCAAQCVTQLPVSSAKPVAPPAPKKPPSSPKR